MLGCMMQEYTGVYKLLFESTGLKLPVTDAKWWIRRRILPDGRYIVFQKNRSSEALSLHFPVPVETETKQLTHALTFQPGEMHIFVSSDMDCLDKAQTDKKGKL